MNARHAHWMQLSIRFVAQLVLLCAVASVSVAAQEATLHSDVRLVVIPATVARGGIAAAGLKATNFVVDEPRFRHEIRVFEEVEASTLSAPRTGDAKENRPLTDPHFDNVILIINFLNNSPDYLRRFKKMLPSIASALQQQNAPVTVFGVTYDGPVLVYTFASPPDGFAQAAQMWASGVPLPGLDLPRRRSLTSLISPEEAAAVLRHEEVNPEGVPVSHDLAILRTLERVLQAFRTFPGRKKILWLDVTFPFRYRSLDPVSMADNDPAKPIAVRVWTALSSENVALYSVGSLPGPSYTFGGSTSDIGWNFPCGNMGRSGGSPIASSSQPANVCQDELPGKCVTRFLNDARHYYLLGFYLQGNISPGWHKVKVKANQPGLRVRSRERYYVPYESAGSNATSRSRNQE